MSRYVVVDFETYPVNGKSLIMEIGCCEVINGEVGKTWETLVKPIAPVSEFVLNLTGINPDALETAPSFIDVLDQFKSFIGTSTIVAHNANLDRSCYEHQLSQINIQAPSFNWVDSQDILRLTIPTIQSLQLQSLLNDYGFVQENEHRALSDALGLSLLLIHITSTTTINLSKIEQAFLKIPEIIEAAAYAVPAKGGSGLEDEVMIALMVRNSKEKNYLKWIKDASPNLANFSMPKYIRIVKNFPKTGTGKIKKYLLKEEGITKDTWIKKIS